ncbi:hydroxymethylbilane synthase [soil metagenome]
MDRILRIGTRESELAVWQATQVKLLLQQQNIKAELVYVKSEGDIDLVTPLYAMGVQGVFTRTLDAALLNDRIDIAVHSMKDVPVDLPEGIRQTAILKRASYKDLFVFKGDKHDIEKVLHTDDNVEIYDFTIATSSIRRKAQWLHRYPQHNIENLRGNVNTRLRKVVEQLQWNGAIFAAAGLERINLRPENSIELDWMLPAPAQGAIMIVCRTNDADAFESCSAFNNPATAICTKVERDFLKALMGGCSTPISALAEIKDDTIFFKGNICDVAGKDVVEIEEQCSVNDAATLGFKAADKILKSETALEIIKQIRDAKN